MLDTISELPGLWSDLVARFPKLKAIPGEKYLKNLANWFSTGVVDQATFQLPNVILTPLVVLTQLTQFSRYLSLLFSNVSTQGQDLQTAFSKLNVETVGFCTGLLSASAASSSFDKASFQQYGAVAIRLAALIGAFVDAQDVSDRLHGRSKSFAVAWTSESKLREMVRILDGFPEAYISVLYDEKRATLTTAEGTAPLLVQQLREAGVTVAEVGLRGRFHCQCHHEDLGDIINYCDSNPAFQFPGLSDTAVSINLNPTGKIDKEEKLHHAVIRMILVEQSQWYQTFASVQTSRLKSKGSTVVSFGPDRGVPPSLMRNLGAHFLHATDLDQAGPQPVDSALDPFAVSINQGQNAGSDDEIAIVGMSCQVAGADDLGEFWKILCEGKSQHIEIPEERFGFETQWRDVDKTKKWYGNFINDHDVYDHKFFKKSPREIISTDPQQRLMMQCAYQAVEQSGYFHQSCPDTNIGIYIGACAADYEHNVAGYPANAFTATGNLKSFIAGKISHYFGWTGPGLVIDTACSSSAVATHQACRAILSGECSAALVGGVALMGNIIWFQNLAGASFLSPTGQCKPWDDKADGYCRGEAIACVFLKKMSTAIADGNQILGCISSTSVTQNENCTPVFVPNSPSLSHLFKDVIHKAKMEAEEISFVEAHGTGTPVGDPAEYESIRQALGGPTRSKALSLGSVKGLVGHTEGASGVVSLIKTVLMIQEGIIPPQASFDTLSHHINASSTDMMEIPTKPKPWDAKFKAALINNYGASGSNASMIVTQPFQIGQSSNYPIHSGSSKHPFWICGLDDRSLRDYCTKLLNLIRSRNISVNEMSIANLSFNICRQSNRALERGLIFNSSTIEDVEDKLAAFSRGEGSISSTGSRKTPLPVIMCFGGQISTFIGLDKNVYDSVRIFRCYLDQCNAVFLSIGLDGIYPDIFQRKPVEDTIKLQTMLFAIQYACAKSWIDCGVQIAAVVGHSFGELTALCVSGVLSLKDTAKMIADRALLVRDSWGTDRGSMMAIEADLEVVQNLIAEAGEKYPDGAQATIACYNGPRSFTLAGSTEAIDNIAKMVADPDYSSCTRTKKLNVTNAFHSTLVEPLMEGLEGIGDELNFREAVIQLERSTEESYTEISSEFVAEHMRNPVYFNHAVQRLAGRYPSAIWLEAGSNSTITTMASRALGSPSDSCFQGINITSDNGLRNLADATTALWEAGLKTEYWPHHALQTYEYGHIFLPPYQFEKVKHWMDLKQPLKTTVQVERAPKVIDQEVPTGLLTFIGYQDEEQRSARFRINTFTKKYEDFISGHLIANTAPICPATLEVDMTIEALMSIRPDFAANDPSRFVWIEFEALDVECHSWSWKIISNVPEKPRSETEHVHGKLIFRSVHEPEYEAEFARYERLVRHERCLDILKSDDADDIIQGRNIYTTFSSVVDYGEQYRGVKKIVGLGNESVGRVVKKYTGETWLDTHLSDCFSQVGGIWANCMTNTAPEDMFIASGCELLIRSPKVLNDSPRPEMWHVYAHHHQKSEKEYTTDVFTFDGTNGQLVEVMLGIKYAKVPKASMRKILTRLSPGVAKPTPLAALDSSTPEKTTNISASPNKPAKKAKLPKVKKEKKQRSGKPDIKSTVKSVLSNISGIDVEDIKEDTELANIGIDSLMGMELAREIETVFECPMPAEKLAEVFDFPSLVDCIKSALPPVEGGVSEEEDDNKTEYSVDDDDESSKDSETISSAEDSAAEDSKQNSTTSASSVSGSSTKPRTSTPFNGAVPFATSGDNLKIPASAILECFGEVKMKTDQMIQDYKSDNFADIINPKITQLCITLTLDAFEKLGVSIRTAKAGQVLQRIQYASQHRRLVDYLYELLEKEARLIEIDGTKAVRTGISPPTKSSNVLYQELLRLYPDWNYAVKLTQYAGTRLVDVLTNKTDGIKLIFGNDEGRELVGGLYCDHVFNRMNYQQMADVVEKLILKLPMRDGPLRILELGAGTGGTTLFMAPLLARLGAPVEYTFTDLSASMVGLAKKKFKEYPFMKFFTHDMEKPIPEELKGTQHLVLASNAIHATHDLVKSCANIRESLREDGFMMILEMTEIVPFVDIIFGLLEGWWLFDDGRKHAIASPDRWERDMQTAGFGHVDYTDGHLAENKIQKVIMALASGPTYPRLPIPEKPAPKHEVTDLVAREKDISNYVRKFSAGFEPPTSSESAPLHNDAQCVLITGTTGSLGSHLAKEFAERPDVKTVICLNRNSKTDPLERQKGAFASRGVVLDDTAFEKLQIIETDTTKPKLGLSDKEYDSLVQNVTGILHNAWPMSGKRALKGFEGQFKALRNLVDLAREAACTRPASAKITFQLISSIGVVGYYPLWSGITRVPEERMEIKSVLPNGYCDAKFTCERILNETLHKYPDRFRTMTARLGQIAGSTVTGYWNPMEHFSFLVKSSKSLKVLPDFEGVLSWCPVNSMAAVLTELLLSNVAPHAIYHVDNPKQQPWREMIGTLADALDVPTSNIIPFREWVSKVRRSPLSIETDNPAGKLIDFLDDHFLRMSCGGLILDTKKSCEHSPTLAATQPVSVEVARKYVKAWEDMGFLY
ncbi:Conidial yellow pigment biosynthesis polyketide synthase [Daldinia childiae]|uniref:Conidial yellow pigment biosynthesis polyketide synthase n=1 Tax=Daldinia childiae TaxID=326645 RepID=UPI001446932C|nr:Conidial yellow pigment biosynthesis polyketide synthase [Daldinia childiae]KAF3055676.1 Conidial yellow pigment biosynthesis polyketide synthase [Daldinia childiae]